LAKFFPYLVWPLSFVWKRLEDSIFSHRRNEAEEENDDEEDEEDGGKASERRKKEIQLSTLPDQIYTQREGDGDSEAHF